jgi:uncharacterized HhH-GPD family protein
VRKISRRRLLRLVAALLAFGRSLAREDVSYTPNKQADAFVKTSATAWLLGVIFDQLIDARRAWAAPYRLRQRLGYLGVRALASTHVGALRAAIREEPALALYPQPMARWIKGSMTAIRDNYSGRTEGIWSDALTAGEVIARLRKLPGVSQKKANMAARILHEEDHPFCRRRFDRWDQIDVAVDSQVARVARRTGISTTTKPKDVVLAARCLNPRYPGALDAPMWEIGRTWCRPKKPDCDGGRDGRPCPLSKLCPRIGVP